jgi:REP-associated tyrosine transposase
VARELRFIDPDVIYHATCRGSNRGRIVWDEHDCRSFTAELDYVAGKFDWRVYSWCLMPNHHHIVLRASQASFSEGFHQLNGNHSRRTNRRHGRSDHLFRNRPRAEPIASVAHLVNAVVYVARNPLEAGLCTRADSWRYGSYRALAGLEPAPPWLAIDEVHDLFGPTPAEAARGFTELVHRGPVPVSDTDDPPAPEPTPALTAA